MLPVTSEGLRFYLLQAFGLFGKSQPKGIAVISRGGFADVGFVS
jgi:hypothetical protein